MTKRTTIHDVANAANVSVATVSNALRGTKFVAPALRERVLEAVEALGYRVDVAAAGLRRRKSGFVGVIVPNIQASFFSSLVTQIESNAAESEYQILLANTQENAGIEELRLKALIDRGAEGIIWVPSVERSNLTAELSRIKMPVVIVDRDVDRLVANRIFVNNFAGGAIGAEHLFSKGHKRILFIARDRVPNIQRRVAGYESALQKHQIDTSTVYLDGGIEDRAEAISNLISRVMNGGKRPTAIFCSTYTVLLGVMRSLTECNYAIPTDVSLLAFDDFDWMDAVRPSITTISQPVDVIAYSAWSLLFDQLKGVDRPPATYEFDCRLIERDSVADIRGNLGKGAA